MKGNKMVKDIMNKDNLIKMLATHQHVYDMDCGEDFGCSCRLEGIINIHSHEIDESFDFVDHLADVILAKFAM